MIRELLKNVLSGQVFILVNNLLENEKEYNDINLEELSYFIKLYDDNNTEMTHVLGLNGIPYLFSKEADVIAFSFENNHFNLCCLFHHDNNLDELQNSLYNFIKMEIK